MSGNIVIEINTKGLDKIIRALKGKLPEARVGILGNKAARPSGGPQNNAEVGAQHEFGDSHLPVRSFLRMPIMDNLQKYLERSNAFDKDTLKKVVNSGSITEWMKKIAVVSESIISDAFATGGFGKWRPSNMENKKNKQTLVETQQLRNSITSEVRE